MLRKIALKINYLLQKTKNNRLAKNLAVKIESENKAHRIFLFQTPTHSNIGDHAIAEAELEFLYENFSNYTVYEINDDLLEIVVKNYSHLFRKADIILLHGGGNFGNEYILLEKTRRLIVTQFTDNKIVVFPQTIHYSKDVNGQHELQITQEIFAKHPNLTLTARENVSYELMKQYFKKNKVILTPDIVLYTSHLGNQERYYGLEVIRQDQESILSDLEKMEVHNLLTNNFEQVINSDMHVSGFRNIRTPEDRRHILEDKLNQFRSSNLVITDRLHGMVLATITGTRCIVFSNYNQKVLGTYEWIKDLRYIKFVKNVEEAKIAFRDLKELGEYECYDKFKIKEIYSPLVNAIK